MMKNWIANLSLVILIGFVRLMSEYDDIVSSEDDVNGHEVLPFAHGSDIDPVAAKGAYDRLITCSAMPVYGHCWTKAISSLQSSCPELTDRKFLAFQFTHCLLGKADAVETVVCPPNQDLTTCAENQSANFFQSYFQFFTQTQSICFYLSSEQWLKSAERQVVHSLNTSVVVAGHLEQAEAVQMELFHQQKQALVNAEEVRVWIANAVDRITLHLQNVFVNEWTGFYSLMFCIVMIALCVVLAATQRTAGTELTVGRIHDSAELSAPVVAASRDPEGSLEYPFRGVAVPAHQPTQADGYVTGGAVQYPDPPNHCEPVLEQEETYEERVYMGRQQRKCSPCDAWITIFPSNSWDDHLLRSTHTANLNNATPCEKCGVSFRSAKARLGHYRASKCARDARRLAQAQPTGPALRQY